MDDLIVMGKIKASAIGMAVTASVSFGLWPYCSNNHFRRFLPGTKSITKNKRWVAASWSNDIERYGDAPIVNDALILSTQGFHGRGIFAQDRRQQRMATKSLATKSLALINLALPTAAKQLGQFVFIVDHTFLGFSVTICLRSGNQLLIFDK